MLRATYYARSDAQQMVVTDAPDDEYRTTIKTAELNALNASLAVIRYKQLRGFYAQDTVINHLLFGISDLHLVTENGPA